MGANSWVKRGKRVIFGGEVVEIGPVVSGFEVRLSCCGARRSVVRSCCIGVVLF